MIDEFLKCCEKVLVPVVKTLSTAILKKEDVKFI